MAFGTGNTQFRVISNTLTKENIVIVCTSQIGNRLRLQTRFLCRMSVSSRLDIANPRTYVIRAAFKHSGI
jgi:hypothetical protein